MSRIDVVPVHEGKGRFKILVNYVQFGIVFHSPRLANNEARKLQEKYPKSELHLAVEEEVESA